MPRGDLDAGPGPTGLRYQRPALPTRRDVERADDTEGFALVVDRRGVIARDTVGVATHLPIGPEGFGYVEELRGATVSGFAIGVAGLAVVQRECIADGGDSVEPGPSVGRLVERGDEPRECVRVVERRGRGGDETDVLGLAGHRGQRGDRLRRPAVEGRRVRHAGYVAEKDRGEETLVAEMAVGHQPLERVDERSISVVLLFVRGSPHVEIDVVADEVQVEIAPSRHGPSFRSEVASRVVL